MPLPEHTVWESVFFDIETTGFQASSSHVYLIGAAYRRGQTWYLQQWMSERPGEEAALLRVFAAFLKPFRRVIHFNGERFDIPYLREKYASYMLEDPLEDLASTDIYRDLKPLKKPLGMERQNQKSWEAFLGIRREDTCDGGELIGVYRSFVRAPSEEKLHLLLLHNREDVEGMLSLTAGYAYLYALGLSSRAVPAAEDASISAAGQSTAGHSAAGQSTAGQSAAKQSAAEHSAAGQSTAEHTAAGHPSVRAQIFGDRLQVVRRLPVSVPRPVTIKGEAASLFLEKNRGTLTVPILEGTLYYFLEPYRDYDYLIEEDMAVHKSVSSFVDRDYRRPATPSTCYVKQTGRYLPQYGQTWQPALKRAFRDSLYWFALRDDLCEDPAFGQAYYDMMVSRML